MTSQQIASVGIAFPNPTYIQASHNVDFTFNAINTPQPIPLNTNDELEGGIQHSETVNNSEFTVTADGVYVIAAQPQLFAGLAGDFRMWLQVNPGTGFADVANSNILLTLPNNQADVIPLIATIRLSAGDVFRLMGVVDEIQVILDSTQPTGEPLVPSIILTAYRIG